jgi:hypothetical protein
MGKTVAIIQSNYIPWKGYFNIIKCVDEFVLLDDVQYTRRDWRNRNLIKTSSGLKWLSIPVNVKGQFTVCIKDVSTAGSDWRLDHWRQISSAYSKSAFFKSLAHHFEKLYLQDDEENLSAINLKFINLINSLLNITTPIRWSTEFDTPDEKMERLIHICKCLQADEYVSGAAAKTYLDVEKFQKNGIMVKWADYANYPVYNQLYEPFEHGVSIIDLLFNEGTQIHHLLKKKIWT